MLLQKMKSIELWYQQHSIPSSRLYTIPVSSLLYPTHRLSSTPDTHMPTTIPIQHQTYMTTPKRHDHTAILPFTESASPLLPCSRMRTIAPGRALVIGQTV